MGRFGTTELVVIFLIVLVLFGSKKLPAIGKGLGQGIRDFRKSIKGEDDIDVTPSSASETSEKPKIEQDINATQSSSVKEKKHA